MWVLIDNYDSFSHVLLHYLQLVHPEVRVFRNDECSVADLKNIKPERIVLSPGPRRPVHSGITNEVIEHFHDTTPILGICLGHQALGEYFGARLHKAVMPMHGKVSKINIKGEHEIFHGLGQSIDVMRYHSLALEDYEESDIIPLAATDEGELMAFSHSVFPAIGLQFHPESILTPDGEHIIRNWASMLF